MLNINGSGYLGQDSELITSKNNPENKILKFSIGSKNTGSKDNQKTSWIDCVILNTKRAESLAGFLKKARVLFLVANYNYQHMKIKKVIKRKMPQLFLVILSFYLKKILPMDHLIKKNPLNYLMMTFLFNGNSYHKCDYEYPRLE